MSVTDKDKLDTTGWSERNIEILHLYLAGYSHGEIADRVGLKEQTVANIISIYKMSSLRHQHEQAKIRRAAEQYLEHEDNLRSGKKSVFGKPPSWAGINLRLHAGQLEAYDIIQKNFAGETPAAIVTIICGRAWGKTIFLGYMLAEYLQANPNSQVLWVAPFTSTCMSLISEFFNAINEETGERFVDDYDEEGNRIWEFVTTKSGPMLRWWNGATVTFRSAESPESIVSRGYHRVIFDEFALVSDEAVFKQRILGVARKRGVKIFLISTPRGKNWAYNLFQKGLDPSETNYLSIHQPYNRNPHFSKTLETLIRDLPEFLMRQEYLAEFIEDGQCVLRGVDQCVVGEEIYFPTGQQEWAPEVGNITERRFVIGLDIAKSVDFTVLFGIDVDSGECVYYRRMNKKDYKEVLQIASDVCRQLNDATLVYDSTGVGAGLSDFIDQYGVVSKPFIFTNESKNELINKLALSIEHKKLKLPNIPTVLKELRSYAFELTKTGKISYNAPAGTHDDCVISLALANLYCEDNRQSQAECKFFDWCIEYNSRESPKNFWEYMQQDND